MTRLNSQALYGSLVATTAVILTVLSFSPSPVIQYVLAIGLIAASIFAFVTAYKSKDLEIQQKYSLLQGVGLLAYGLSVLVLGFSFSQFITINLLFLVYFGVSEILFALEVSSYKKLMNLDFIGLKIGNGFLIAVGAVVAFGMSFANHTAALLISAGLTFFMGVGFILLSRLAKLSPVRLDDTTVIYTDKSVL